MPKIIKPLLVFSFLLLLTPFQAMSEEKTFTEKLTEAAIDFRAYKDAREKALPQLRAVRGMLWACGNCAQKENIITDLNALLNDRDAMIFGTRLAGIKTSPTDSAAKKFLYGSPYGDIPRKCRKIFNRWADCSRDSGLKSCLEVFEPYKQCRNQVEFNDVLPSFPPESSLGKAARKMSRFNELNSLLAYENLYLSAKKIDSMIQKHGRGIMNAASQAFLSNETNKAEFFINDFIQSNKREICSNQHPRWRPYEDFLQLTYLDEYGVFDRDEVEQWLGEVFESFSKSDVISNLCAIKVPTNVRESLLASLYGIEANDRETRRKLLIDSLGNQKGIATLMPSLTDDMIFSIDNPQQLPEQCAPRKLSRHEKADSEKKLFIELFLSEKCINNLEHINLWLDYYEKEFGINVVKNIISQLLKDKKAKPHIYRFVHTRLRERLGKFVTANTKQPKLSNIYSGEFVDASGNSYKTDVEITHRSPGMYNLVWKHPKYGFSATGLLHNGKLAISTDTDGGPPQYYTMLSDGSLKGERYLNRGIDGELINEKLKRKVTKKQSIEGNYRLEGNSRHRSGSEYTGKCNIKNLNSSAWHTIICDWAFTTGTNNRMRHDTKKGKLFGDRITINEVVAYQIKPDGVLEYRSTNGKLWDKLIPVSEDEPGRQPTEKQPKVSKNKHHKPTNDSAKQNLTKSSKIGEVKADLTHAKAVKKTKKAVDTKKSSANGKYDVLLQKLNCPTDKKAYGDFKDYGYWKGGKWCGQTGVGGYWVWLYPDWYVWKNKVK